MVYLALISEWGEVPRDVVRCECVGVYFGDHGIGGEVAQYSSLGI